MRLFVAINFDEKAAGRMLDIQRQFKETAQASFSLPENLHLTLVFLGEVAPGRVAAVQSAIDAAATFAQVEIYGFMLYNLLTLQRRALIGPRANLRRLACPYPPYIA